MKKHFYSQLIETDSLIIALNDLKISEKEKKHLLSLVESSLHYAIMDAILAELSEEDKKVFTKFSSDNYEKIWEFLSEKIENIEDKISKTAKNLTERLHRDILETKGKNK